MGCIQNGNEWFVQLINEGREVYRFLNVIW